jgi:hypothetical protein
LKKFRFLSLIKTVSATDLFLNKIWRLKFKLRDLEASGYFQIYVDELDKIKEVPHNSNDNGLLNPGEFDNRDIHVFSLKPNKTRKKIFNFMPNEIMKNTREYLSMRNINPFILIAPTIMQDSGGTPLWTPIVEIEPKSEGNA